MAVMMVEVEELQAYRFLVVEKRRQLLFSGKAPNVTLRSSDKLGNYTTFTGRSETEALFVAAQWHSQNWTPFSRSDEEGTVPLSLFAGQVG